MSTDLATMIPQTFSELVNFANMAAKTGLVPKEYRNKPEGIIVAAVKGAEIGLHPMQAVANIAVINGRASIWGDAVPALVMNHPKYDDMKIEFDEATQTAKCTVWRLGGKHAFTATFSREDAKRARLAAKDGCWQGYPRQMLINRARAFACRRGFPDAMCGLLIVEEAKSIEAVPEIPTSGAERDITPISEESALMVEQFLTENGKTLEGLINVLPVACQVPVETAADLSREQFEYIEQQQWFISWMQKRNEVVITEKGA